MVRHNNMIPNGHFHKKWQQKVKLWFNQPMKKLRRKALRAKKSRQLAPKPTELLRPLVHCPSERYKSKVRAGRGFTFQELKQAGMSDKYARSFGVAVDPRRRNRCTESIAANIQRLIEYKSRLIFLPDSKNKVLKIDDGKNLNVVKVVPGKVKALKVGEEEKKFEAFVTLRRARCDEKFAGIRMKRKLKKSEGFEGKAN
ncbi:large ribosomal subunit protein eL13 [Tribolium castaneum]|uniref:60S ribosomal protein L13 n=1 Tax=Tribolium castaneum TaxID=7070 RepID=D6WJ61_TRICA|nr:PREDICTED: 60S ribosomal protein L13 [Tribolium castaneum]EFA03166.1 60S ribosomal protein L13-like Protein [Tribolium castaneum]|eukprot:XP_975091.1 PREDICTED: 60S ribosomal protein L13 [Tribolium castaneum]